MNPLFQIQVEAYIPYNEVSKVFFSKYFDLAEMKVVHNDSLSTTFVAAKQRLDIDQLWHGLLGENIETVIKEVRDYFFNQANAISLIVDVNEYDWNLNLVGSQVAMFDKKIKQIQAPQSNIAINDYTCPSCKNDRCSKSEKNCWRCGSVL